jgi:hypothetical protein|tara:strand:+ start:5510 stop:5689 length:180 start_codon:yes stop_codon:yes gene_type:complete
MIDIIIFAILLYILITQEYIRLADDKTGIYAIFSWKTNNLDEKGFRIDTHYRIKRLWRY